MFANYTLISTFYELLKFPAIVHQNDNGNWTSFLVVPRECHEIGIAVQQFDLSFKFLIFRLGEWHMDVAFSAFFNLRFDLTFSVEFSDFFGILINDFVFHRYFLMRDCLQLQYFV